MASVATSASVTAGGVEAAHSHGHLSVGVNDVRECIDRVHTTVSACLKRVGMEADAMMAADSSSPSPRTSSSSMLGRLGSRLSSTLSLATTSGDDDGGTQGEMLEVRFGGETGDSGGGSGLYLSSD